jgi:hypothetical protein
MERRQPVASRDEEMNSKRRALIINYVSPSATIGKEVRIWHFDERKLGGYNRIGNWRIELTSQGRITRDSTRTSNSVLRRRMPHRPGLWTEKEIAILRHVYVTESIGRTTGALPRRTWSAIQGKARLLRLKRPGRAPLSRTLNTEVGVGFSAGMIVADGSVMERCVHEGKKRANAEGGGIRIARSYSVPCVQVSMEDKQSLARLAGWWGVKTVFWQKSSVGNEVWKVVAWGRRALDLLKLILPLLEGEKRRRAMYLLAKYSSRPTLRVKQGQEFRPFRDMT